LTTHAVEGGSHFIGRFAPVRLTVSIYCERPLVRAMKPDEKWRLHSLMAKREKGIRLTTFEARQLRSLAAKCMSVRPDTLLPSRGRPGRPKKLKKRDGPARASVRRQSPSPITLSLDELQQRVGVLLASDARRVKPKITLAPIGKKS
jgi:hypothetical protein